MFWIMILASCLMFRLRLPGQSECGEHSLSVQMRSSDWTAPVLDLLAVGARMNASSESLAQCETASRGSHTNLAGAQ